MSGYPGECDVCVCYCVLLEVVLNRFGRDVECPDYILCNELNESVSMTIGLSIDCSFSLNSGMLTADDTLPSLVFEPSV